MGILELWKTALCDLVGIYWLVEQPLSQKILDFFSEIYLDEEKAVKYIYIHSGDIFHRQASISTRIGIT